MFEVSFNEMVNPNPTLKDNPPLLFLAQGFSIIREETRTLDEIINSAAEKGHSTRYISCLIGISSKYYDIMSRKCRDAARKKIPFDHDSDVIIDVKAVITVYT